MNFKDIPIAQLIPQRPPFVMVDRVVSCEADTAETEFDITEDNIFLEGGHLQPAGIIENMAQSCAARMGCVNISHNEAIRIGVIGDIRDCCILRFPSVRDKLTTHISILEEFFSLTLAEITTKVGDEFVATTRMKIALTE